MIFISINIVDMNLFKLSFSLILFFLLMLFHPSKSYAIGQWQTTGTLNDYHWFTKLVLLKDGNVLTMSGAGVPYVSSSEIYDTVLNDWLYSGHVNVPRDQFEAVLLDDGQVLITGGQFGPGSGPTGSTELYNPITQTWSITDSLSIPRQTPLTVKLKNGKVLATGGLQTAATELYDPITHTWEMLTETHVQRAGNNREIILLDNGKVLVIGSPYEATVVTELFDPATNTWSLTGNLIIPRKYGTLTKLTDGRVLLVNGINDTGYTTDAEIYDPMTEKWTSVAPLTYTRHLANAITLDDGRVLVAGGGNEKDADMTKTEIYNPNTNTWSIDASLHVGHHTADMVKLKDGKVLIGGGYDSFTYGTQTNVTEVYTPEQVEPVSRDDCKKKGWTKYTNLSFKNEGQCLIWIKKQ